MNIELERQQFEKWVIEAFDNLSVEQARRTILRRNLAGQYRLREIHFAWATWQVRMAQDTGNRGDEFLLTLIEPAHMRCMTLLSYVRAAVETALELPERDTASIRRMLTALHNRIKQEMPGCHIPAVRPKEKQ